MSLFNPWLGFPAKNAVYLDRDFVRQRGNGQAAYGTIQEAYDYAAALTGISIVFIGVGTSADFGNLSLSADYNSNVILVGVSKHLSQIGNITASGSARNIDLKIVNLTVANITSKDPTNTVTSGDITISGNGYDSAEIGIVNSQGVGVGAGNISLSYLHHGPIQCQSDVDIAGSLSLTDTTGSTVNASAVGGGHVNNITLLRALVSTINWAADTQSAYTLSLTASTATTITTSTSGTGGTVSIVNSTTGNIVYGDGDQGLLTISNSTVGGIQNGSIFPSAFTANVKAYDTRFEPASGNAIQQISNATVLIGCILKTAAANSPCIGSAIGALGTSSIVGSSLISDGTGAAIDGDGTGVILVDGMRVKNDVTNVTVNGQYTVNVNYAYPA